jgi:hypothetical protein
MAGVYVRFAAQQRPLFDTIYNSGLDKSRYPELQRAREPVSPRAREPATTARARRDLRRERAAAVPGSSHEVTGPEAGNKESCGRDRGRDATGTRADCRS